jgi:hypothetical protein
MKKTEDRRRRTGGGRLLRWLLIGVVVLTAREYAQWTFDNLSRAQMIVMGLEERPYVYRALVPWLARVLVMLGLRADMALMIVVILSAIGLVYGIKYLFAAFRRP